ncbi:MAG: hypothetical protein JSS49_29010 [Planctomycetes bacterium]|nr:hypothetical protein [Planctomycetota bacterium]
MNEAKQNDRQSELRSNINLILLVVLAHAHCMLPFLRYSCGTNVPGIYGVLAFFLILVVIIASKSTAMLGFLMLWILALTCQRIWTVVLHLRGRREHSWYGGSPWLAMLIPFCKSESTAKNVEPALCLSVGWAIWHFFPSVGMFVALGAMSLGIIRVAQHVAINRQVTALIDMELEQQALALQMRRFNQRSWSTK